MRRKKKKKKINCLNVWKLQRIWNSTLKILGVKLNLSGAARIFFKFVTNRILFSRWKDMVIKKKKTMNIQERRLAALMLTEIQFFRICKYDFLFIFRVYVRIFLTRIFFTTFETLNPINFWTLLQFDKILRHQVNRVLFFFLKGSS